MKRINATLEDDSYEILLRYKEKHGYRSLEIALNAMIKESGKK